MTCNHSLGFASFAICFLFAGSAPAVEPRANSGLAAADEVAAAFEQLTVRIEPDGLGQFHQTEELKIGADGVCWYKVEAIEGKLNSPGRSGAIFKHELASERMARLNELLKRTGWLSAEGAAGRATHTHPATVTIDLKLDDADRSVVCHGDRPEPYASLLHELHGLALQERRIYLHDYAPGSEGRDAWGNVGREIAALRGEPYQESPFAIDYQRYLPIAQRIVRRFHSESDEELIPALRLIGQLRASSERKYLHRLAYDRNRNVRHEVAWALGRIRDKQSLPVLAGVMSQCGDEKVGVELIRWGDEGVPFILPLIAQSTDDRLSYAENSIGERMIRTYLENWSDLEQPIDDRVVTAVRKAVANKDPANGTIRIEYHETFLEQVAKQREDASR